MAEQQGVSKPILAEKEHNTKMHSPRVTRRGLQLWSIIPLWTCVPSLPVSYPGQALLPENREC